MRQRFGSTQVVGYQAPPESNLSVLDAGLSSQPGKLFSARNTGQIAGRLEATLERAVRVSVVALEQGGGKIAEYLAWAAQHRLRQQGCSSLGKHGKPP